MSNTQRLFFKSPDGFPKQLRPSDRERGQRLFRRFLKLNGISVSLLMENMLVLYAIRNGVSDGLVATIASFIHLTMPFMVVGKLSVSRIGVASTWGLGLTRRSSGRSPRPTNADASCRGTSCGPTARTCSPWPR